MRAYVGITDGDWFELLRADPGLASPATGRATARRRRSCLGSAKDAFAFS
jgi:hypothetical protein